MTSHSEIKVTSASRLTRQSNIAEMAASTAMAANVRENAGDPTGPGESARLGEYGSSPGTHSATKSNAKNVTVAHI